MSVSIRTKVVGSVLLASGAFLVAAVILVEGPLHGLLRDLLVEEQEKNALRLADDLANSQRGLEHAAEIASRAATILARRVTIIARDGVVLADTADPPEYFPSASRPEI